MKKQLFIIALLATLFVACENDNAVIENVEVIELVETDVSDDGFIGEEVSVTATHIATFEVEGMMCQKGCGSVIRKGLYETGGVALVEVSFEDEDPVNEIKVYFDKKVTSIEVMISVIDNLADSRYNAKLKSISESTISAS